MRLRRKRMMLLALCLTAVLLMGCSAGSGVEKNQFEVGDKVSAYWFDFRVDQVEVTDSHGIYTARDGYRLAVCHLTIKNTFDEDVPMGWADFILQWESGGEDDGAVEGAYTLPQYAEDQLRDEYTLEKGGQQEGVLVFEVPEEVSRAALVFQELYADGESTSEYTEGSSYYVWMDL